ncbi:MAG: hypothetical protein LBS34_00415 [Rickettsiales bacterium]|nr:hypothetical protein [Rickettsiales bacterium]
MKKVFYVVCVALTALVTSVFLKFNGEVIAYFDGYEIVTNGKTVILFVLLVFTAGYFISSILHTLRRPNKLKLLRKTDKVRDKYENYITNMSNACVHGLSGEFKEAYKKIRKANGYVKNNFTEIVRSQILYMEQKYDDSINIVKNMDKIRDGSLADYSAQLACALQSGNRSEIKTLANRILELQKDNIHCLNILYNLHKDECDWEKCLSIIQKTKKNVVKQEYKRELLTINTNLAKLYFGKQDYKNSLKYALEAFAVDKHLHKNNSVLIHSLFNLKSSKTGRFIEKAWKFTPREEFGSMYINGISGEKSQFKKARHLYNLNKSDINSIIFYSNILIKNNNFDAITNDMKEILNNYRYKEVFEILLKIEERDKTDSFLISSLREKIKNSKSINS